MRINVIPSQRLLHHEQVEGIEFPQMIGISRRVGRIRVHRQHEFWKLLTHSGDKLKVFAGFDFELDALVPAVKFLLDLVDERQRIGTNAQRDSAGNLVTSASHEPPKWNSLLLRLNIPKGVLDASFRHGVAANAREQRCCLRSTRELPA